MEIKTISTANDISVCKDIILAFRTNLKEEGYEQAITHMIKNESLHIDYVYDPEHRKAAAFVGYRYMCMLRTGPIIYIDDLYTDPAYRGKGCGAALLAHVKRKGIEKGMKAVHLDSGFPLHPAHRLYLKSGFDLACHHFALTLA
ncbi:GNAT family N-acetyltransferase [Sphingobacterium kitahiroshimense]|uniref:GNAT family N-acetyltransferase n=1 Tax=Sphingobacterium kitahiroshimense TaxID=470446 RepID=UPI00320B2505